MTFLFSLLFVAGAWAETPYVEPMELSLRPEQRMEENAGRLRVINRLEHSTSVKVSGWSRVEDTDGIEKRTGATDLEFDATEFRLQPGQSREIKIWYKGESEIKKEKPFRIVVRQTGDRKTGVDFNFVSVVSLYVTPTDAKPNLIVRKAEVKNSKRVDVEIENSGASHAKALGLIPRLEQKAASGVRVLELSSQSREEFSRLNVLAGLRRKFTFVLNDNQKIDKDRPVDVSFTAP